MEIPVSLEFVRNFLLWCTIINYGILAVWFLFFAIAHDFIYRLHGRWFRLPPETFDALHYMGMAVFKIGVLILNVVPLVVLCLL
jgi:hypothetical protein